jgi:hypothetical protein
MSAPTNFATVPFVLHDRTNVFFLRFGSVLEDCSLYFIPRTTNLERGGVRKKLLLLLFKTQKVLYFHISYLRNPQDSNLFPKEFLG